MGRTLTQLVQGVGRKLSRRSRYVTAAGTGGVGTWTDATNLRDTPADFYNGMYLFVSGDSLPYRVSDDDGSGVLTLDTSATPTSTKDYELLPVNPDYIVTAINRAAARLEDKIGRTRTDNSYVTNSPLFNAGFEDTTGASAIDGWQASVTTMARESTAQHKLGGVYSVKLSTSAGYIEPTAEFQGMFHDLEGHTITVYFPCKSDTTSCSRLRIVTDGTTTNGSYHTGGSGWETLEVTATIPDPVDTLTVRLMHDSASGVAYWDNGWMEGGVQLSYYRLPTKMVRGPSFITLMGLGDRDVRWQYILRRRWSGWRFVREEDPAVTTTRNGLYVTRPPSMGRWLMMGWEPLNTLSARTDVAEVDFEQAELLELEAAILLITEGGQFENRMRLADLTRQRDELRTKFKDVLGAAQLSP